jgi:hypothetical protein
MNESRQDRYSFGWTNPRGMFGEYKPDPWYYHLGYKIKMTLSYILLFLSLTMATMPMMWVDLFQSLFCGGTK